MGPSISRNGTVTTSTTSIQACNKVMNGYRRSQVIITNTSTTAVITISKGIVAAVAGSGIRIPPNGAYFESTDSGFMCWQDEIQVVSDVAGSCAVVEQLEPTG
jgi:hypothetical protein